MNADTAPDALLAARPPQAPADDDSDAAVGAARSDLKSHVEIHSHSQIELRSNYALDARGLYTVDTYLFVPRNVGLHRGNFTKEQFYGDMTSHMRLAAEPLPLSQLGDVHRTSSPLHRLAAELDAFRSSIRPPPSRPAAVHVKLYAYLYTISVKAELGRLAKRLKSRRARDEAERTELERKLLRTLRSARRALWAFRRVREGFRPFEQLCHRALAESLRVADEHMSLYLEERLSCFATTLDRRPQRLHGSDFVARCRLAAEALAREEAAYRRRCGYVTLDADDPAEGEYFTYRASQIKKNVHGALYLDPDKHSGDSFVRNAAAAVGAALAAIWALATQVPATLAGESVRAKTIFFIGAVLTYVMKDRIKALTNESLMRRIHAYDRVSWLHGASLEAVGLGMLRVRLRESMHFLPLDELPPEVSALRGSRPAVRFSESAPENVIHLRREIDLVTHGKAEPLPMGYCLHDIVRLNLRHFLVRLDDPFDHTTYFDQRRSTFASVDLPKVYHVNVVVRLSRNDAAGPPLARLDLWRIILRKDGIVRVEELGSRPVARPE